MLTRWSKITIGSETEIKSYILGNLSLSTGKSVMCAVFVVVLVMLLVVFMVMLMLLVMLLTLVMLSVGW